MTANRNLLRMKYAKVILAYAKRTDSSFDEALKVFYNSDTYALMRDGISDMHCMSVAYIVDDLLSHRAAATDCTDMAR